MENTKKSLYTKLNSIIDAQLEQGSSDTELILACCDAVLRLKKEESYQLTKEERDANREAILQGAVKNKRRRKIGRILLVAAIIMALLIGSVFAYTVIEYKIYDYDTYSTVWSNIIVKKIDEPVVVSYVPEGFELVEEDFQKYTSSKVYEKGEKVLTISKDSFNSVQINTEYGKARVFTIDGIDYVLFGEEVHGKGVVWFSGHYSYSLTAPLSDEELLKIAQGVR